MCNKLLSLDNKLLFNKYCQGIDFYKRNSRIIRQVMRKVCGRFEAKKCGNINLENEG